jgi:ATP/maltotriose-dependent transcriptional regulator MalT
MLRGELARAEGWCARATRLLDDAGVECAARGSLAVPAVLQTLAVGDAETAEHLAGEVVAIARRFGDHDVLALGLISQGHACLMLGDMAGGMRLLDEVMVSVAAGEVSPFPAGIVYCAVIEACMDVMDLPRATAWTEALSEWCAAQPDLVPYRGQCLVHRAQVLQAHGDWERASNDAEQARQRLSEPVHPALGLALYQVGELHRLRGDLIEAERAYRAASEHGRPPAPGSALLRLADGNVDAAATSIRRMVDESRGQVAYPTMLAASVEIMLEVGDLGTARDHADELARVIGTSATPLLRAVSDYASGSVRLAAHEPVEALPLLRRAYDVWHGLGMPYEAAWAQLQIGRACRLAGDHDAAAYEIDAARATFERLGARPALDRLRRLCPERRARPGALTDRECEVLRLVAAGKSNRDIATALVISEHTVGRHLQNIFTKLGVSSRSAATAFAYQHDIV